MLFFGIAVEAVQMTVYKNTSKGMKIWVRKDVTTKIKGPGKLFNTIVEEVQAGETPLDAIAQSLKVSNQSKMLQDLALQNAQVQESLSWLHRSNEEGRAEPDLLFPVVQHVYDLEVHNDVLPVISQGSNTKQFYELDLGQVKQVIQRGEVDLGSTWVLIDSLIRYGQITLESEPDFEVIKKRLRRKLPLAGI